MVGVLWASQAFGTEVSLPSGDVFEKIQVEGASCADSSPYYIYIRHGDPSKLLIHFQGGGACWNKTTCFGLPLTSRRDRPDFYSNFYVGPHLRGNPFNEHTYVYLPYCTGDLHAGTHTAHYGSREMKHWGRINVDKAFSWIEANKDSLVSRADEVNVYGESAGALGAILNLNRVERITKPSARKLLIADSPGLHFNQKIWGRFSKPFLRDLDARLEQSGMTRFDESGLLAPQMKTLCEKYDTWKIGFLQASRDVVMSLIFGRLSSFRHYFRVMGRNGLHRTLWDPTDNCSSWIPDSPLHIFGTYALSWNSRTWDGVSAGEYIRSLQRSDLLSLQPSHH